MEDDADLRELLQIYLRLEGFEVLACGDGRRAYQVFTAVPEVDLLVSDVQIPHLSGPDLALTVISIKPSVAVILMSGEDAGQDLLRSAEMHHWMFLNKPFTFPVLLAAVQHMLHDVQPQLARKLA